MKITNHHRELMFMTAKSIHERLGALVQNQMDIRAEDVAMEMDLLHEEQTKFNNLCKVYKMQLVDILAFMGSKGVS